MAVAVGEDGRRHGAFSPFVEIIDRRNVSVDILRKKGDVDEALGLVVLLDFIDFSGQQLWGPHHIVLRSSAMTSIELPELTVSPY